MADNNSELSDEQLKQVSGGLQDVMEFNKYVLYISEAECWVLLKDTEQILHFNTGAEAVGWLHDNGY